MIITNNIYSLATNKELAKTSSSYRVLDKLSKDQDPNIRAEVARNSYTTIKTLTLLSDDESAFVRMAVASNNRTTLKVLEKLCKDERSVVRIEVSKHTRLSPNLLSLLSLDIEDKVRFHIVINDNTCDDILRKLCDDKNYYICYLANLKLNKGLHQGFCQ